LLARARAVMLTNYHAVARYVGLDPYLMLRQAELHPSELADPENWIPAGRVLNLLEECAFQSGRDDFGVLMGESRTFGSLGPVSLLLKHESTLGVVMDAAINYRKLMNELLELRLEDHGRSAVFEWSLIPGLRSSQGINLLATIAYRVLADGAGFHWQPDCIHFRQTEPGQVATFKRVFRCPLEFNSAFDGMSFASSCLELKNRFADVELATHARRLLDLMPAVRRDDTMTQRVTAAIALHLSNGKADVETVAHCVGVPVRTLQRRLISEGESFSNLLAETRRELAVRYLSSSNQSITAVAQLTGYSALSSFTRWFASEFGMSPKKWRQLMMKRDVPTIELHQVRNREPAPLRAIEAI
jgi:AraC-like DNA-binding protein